MYFFFFFFFFFFLKRFFFFSFGFLVLTFLAQLGFELSVQAGLEGLIFPPPPLPPRYQAFRYIQQTQFILKFVDLSG